MTSVRATLPASLNKSLRPCHCMLHGKLWTTTCKPEGAPSGPPFSPMRPPPRPPRPPARPRPMPRAPPRRLPRKPPRRGAPCTTEPPGPVTLMALAPPFSLVSMSNSTCSLSPSERKPSAWMLVWCTNRSSPPSAGVMNPYPFWELNHFTVPCIRAGGLDGPAPSPASISPGNLDDERVGASPVRTRSASLLRLAGELCTQHAAQCPSNRTGHPCD
mmetsp:Transcript_12660/g.46259  ORF Transcript_12660/g.46259 Transcript_12660/m.46259 type:complete len:216 (-) Transcript_12660:82-729(-)